MFKQIFALIPLLFFCLNINAQDTTFKKQLEYIQKLRLLSKNNLATAYKEVGKHELALSYFIQNLKIQNSELFVVSLDNYAHTLYLSNNYKQLLELYLKVLKICDRIDLAYMVTISFSLKKLVLEIKIHDDGIGFGLKNIASRVLKLESDYNIISSPNKGTELNINIPV